MRLIQNLTISWETNFYGKNTCQGKVITKKMIQSQKGRKLPRSNIKLLNCKYILTNCLN